MVPIRQHGGVKERGPQAYGQRGGIVGVGAVEIKPGSSRLLPAAGCFGTTPGAGGNDEGRAETRPLSIRPKGDLTLRRRHGDRLLQAELQHGFAWNFDLLALGQDLSTRASCAACRRANCRAFTAAGNRANDGASHGADASSLGSRGTLAFALQRVIA